MLTGRRELGMGQVLILTVHQLTYVQHGEQRDACFPFPGIYLFIPGEQFCRNCSLSLCVLHVYGNSLSNFPYASLECLVCCVVCTHVRVARGHVISV